TTCEFLISIACVTAINDGINKGTAEIFTNFTCLSFSTHYDDGLDLISISAVLIAGCGFFINFIICTSKPLSIKQQYTIYIFLFSFMAMNILPSLGGAGGGLLAQTWQWGERGGSTDGAVGSGPDEYPVDIAVDPNGNSYVLSYNVGKTSLSVGSQSVT